MLARMNRVPQRIASVLFSMTLLVVACDDDDHKVMTIIEDNMESSIDWGFLNVNDAGHEGIVDNTTSSSPSHSLSIGSTAAKPGAFSFWRATWSPNGIPVGSSLELRVNIKVDVTGEGAFFALRGDGKSGMVFFQSTQGVQAITGSKDFKTYSLKFDSYPEGVTTMYIFLILDGSSTGVVHFDDVSLVSHH